MSLNFIWMNFKIGYFLELMLACKHAVFFALAHIVAGGAVVAGGGILFGLPNQLVAAAAQRMAATQADVAAVVDNAAAAMAIQGVVLATAHIKAAVDFAVEGGFGYGQGGQ